MKGSENYMSVRGANASRNRTHDVLRRGTGLLVRTALIVWMAGAFGSTTAHAQGPLGQGDAIAKYREALEDADELAAHCVQLHFEIKMRSDRFLR